MCMKAGISDTLDISECKVIIVHNAARLLQVQTLGSPIKLHTKKWRPQKSVQVTEVLGYQNCSAWQVLLYIVANQSDHNR